MSATGGGVLTRSGPTTWYALDDARALGWILALGALIAFAGLGFRDPWPADEPRFAQIAREMVEGGRWLFPTRGGELYSDKPPLFIWLVALAHALGASLRVAFLLPAALGALGTLALVHDIARRLWSARVANVAALALLATLQFALQSRSGQIDMLACIWITLGAWGLLRHLLAGPALGPYLIGWFAMGLGIITKGVGFLPMLLFLPYAALWLGGAREGLVRPTPALALGPLALLAAVSSWLVPMTLAVETSGDPALAAYRDDILFRQTAERYTDSWAHVEPWHYFLVSVIPVLWLPLSALVPWLAALWWRAIRARDARVVLPLAQVVLVIAFFSASPGKRGVYLLPALPMLALASAPFFEALLARRDVRRAALALLVALAVLTAAVALGGLAGVEALARAEAREGIRPWGPLLALSLAAAAGAALAARARPALGWFVFVVSLWLLWGSWGQRVAAAGRTPAAVYRTLLAESGADIRLGLVDFREQWLLFAPVPVTHFGFSTADAEQVREAWRWLAEPDAEGRERRVLLATRYATGECFAAGAGVALGRAHGRDWRLYGAADRTPDCPAPRGAVPRFDYAQPGALGIAP